MSQDISETALPFKQDSYWLKGYQKPTYPQLSEDVNCDIAVVGGGIAGLTCAYLLKQAGFTVAVVEKHTIGSGTSGGTTGKVTMQHGLMFAELEKRHGQSMTRKYADISKTAFNLQQTIIRDKKIACDWQVTDNYIFTAKPQNLKQFKEEAAAAARAGLPASFETQLDLPFETVGAVKFKGQANFHVLKYLSALARLIDGQCSYVFENSQAKHMKEGQPCRVTTEQGVISAKHIIVTTKIPAAPLVARLTYGLDEYPETSYIVAGNYSGGLQGMYISPDKEHYSLLPIQNGKDQLLLIGGENHIPGLGRVRPRHKKLAAYGKQWFNIVDFPYRWKAMDYMAYDSMPVVGKLYPWSKNTYVVSGLKKWGLNLSMVAALVIQDLVLGRETAAGQLFSPHRFSAPASIPKVLLDKLK